MATAFQPDYKGQMVKVAWPCKDSQTTYSSVYGTNASWAEFNNDGELEAARRATSDEVRWWLALQASEELKQAISSLENTMIEQWRNR